MEILQKQQRITLLVFLFLALVGAVSLTLYAAFTGEVLSITDTKSTVVTSDVPHYIGFQIKPESRIPPVANDSASLQIEIRLPGSTTAIETVTASADNNGIVQLPPITASHIPPGVYDIAIKGNAHLRKVFVNQNPEGPAVHNYLFTAEKLKAGDANPTSDNYVNGLDISYLTLHLYSSNNQADLTHDGMVNSLDYAALLKNLYGYGDN